MEENQKIAQIRKLKRINKKLLNIVPLIEKKVGQKLKLLHNNSFYDRCEEYIDKDYCGVSNFYYEWYEYGTMTCVDCMYGVELMNNNFYFVFKKLYVLSKEEIKKFLNFQDFFDFLIKRGKIESPTSQTSPNGDFSNEKEHNISLKTTSSAPSKLPTATSLNNNIHRQDPNFIFYSQGGFN